MAYDDHSGTNKFARTLADRINAQIPSGLIMDFAQVNSDMSLTTNTFPQKIPKDDYTVCRNFTGYTLTTTTNGYHPHNHNVSLPKIKPGDRVLVAWIQNEVVVIDVIVPAKNL